MVTVYLVFLLFLFPWVAAIEALFDTHKWYNGDKEIEHGLSAILRICFGLIITFLYCEYWNMGLEFGACMLISYGAIYWLVFDLITNYRSKRHLLAIGSTAILDKVSKQYGKELVFTFKLITLSCSTYLTLHQI